MLLAAHPSGTCSAHESWPASEHFLLSPPPTCTNPTTCLLQDPGWDAAYSQLQELNGQLVKACVQNPLEYRAVAEAAVLFAARPHDLGLDVQQASDFCARMMG